MTPTTASDPLVYGWWIASRASGLVALVLVTAAVLLGLTLGGRMTRRPGMARVVKTLHEQTALAGLVAVAVHGLTLLGDGWLRPSLANLVAPFTLGYRPVFTGLGVIAAELVAVLALSFYARRRISPRRWRVAHRLTPLAYGLAVAHALGSGSDMQGWVRLATLASVAPVGILLLERLRARPAARPSRPTRPLPDSNRRPLPFHGGGRSQPLGPRRAGVS